MKKTLIPACIVLSLLEMGCTSGPKVYNMAPAGAGNAVGQQMNAPASMPAGVGAGNMAVQQANTAAQAQQMDAPASITVELEANDILATVGKMVQSMLDDREFIEEIGGKRPVLDIGKLDTSRISMRLDHKLITDSMRTRLQRSRKFRFVDHTTSDQDLKFMNDQSLNGMTDPSKAIAMGKQTAAQMYLYGSISEMRHSSHGIIDQYYKITLNLKDLRSGEIVWTDEQLTQKRELR